MISCTVLNVLRSDGEARMANFAFGKALPVSKDIITWPYGCRIGGFPGGNGVLRRNGPRQHLQSVESKCIRCQSDVADCRNRRIWRYGTHCSCVRNRVIQLSRCEGLGSVYGRASAAGLLLLSPRRGNSRGGSLLCESGKKGHESGSVPVVVSDGEIEHRRQELLDEYFSRGKELYSSKEGAATEVLGDEFDGEEKGTIVDRKDHRANNGGRLRKRGIYDVPLSPLRGLIKLQGDSEKDRSQQMFGGYLFNPRTMLTSRTRGIILLNVLTFLYGSNVSIIKAAGAVMDPTLFSVGRFAIASIAFTPFLRRSFTKRSLRKAGLELGLLASGGYLTQSVSLLTSDAARVSFISAFTVIVVPLFASLSGAKINRTTWASAAAALVGVGLLEANGAPFAVGDVWSFASAIIFGVHISRTEHHSTTLSRHDSLPVMALQLVVITVCAALWSTATLLSSGDAVIHFQNVDWSAVWSKAATLPWMAMLYTGLLSTAFCLWIELVSLRDVNATEAAVIYTTEPLWGATFAWVTLGERWGPHGWLGASFIIGGSLTMQLFGHSHSSSADPGYVAHPPASLNLSPDQSEGEGDRQSGGELELVKLSDTTGERHDELSSSDN